MRARELQTSQWGISAEPDIIIQMLFVCLQWRTSSFSYVRPDTWRITFACESNVQKVILAALKDPSGVEVANHGL